MAERRLGDGFCCGQDGAFVGIRHHATQSGSRHTLAEYTRDAIAALVAQGPTLRPPVTDAGSPKAARA